MTDNRQISILDHGLVRLVDYMGDDSSICNAARKSYGEGTKSLRGDRGLIRYLMRHKHTSPLEFVEFVFHLKVPIFVARQLVRHRTFSMNEVSARYSKLPDEYYIPAIDTLGYQSTTNKQGTGDPIPEAEGLAAAISLHNTSFRAFNTYQTLLDVGVSREQARTCLPVSTYTEFYWKANLRNIFHFLKLRLDNHAQYETRQVAKAIADLVRPIVPISFEAFENYDLHAHTFSALEMSLIRKVFEFDNSFDFLSKTLLNEEEGNKLSAREKRELVATLRPSQEV